MVASRLGLRLAPEDVPSLLAMASDPPGFQREGSRVYLGDPTAYLRDLRADAAGQAALERGLALLPGDGEPAYRELLYVGGTVALRGLLVAWAAEDAVVWDSVDRPRRLRDYLAGL